MGFSDKIDAKEIPDDLTNENDSDIRAEITKNREIIGSIMDDNYFINGKSEDINNHKLKKSLSECKHLLNKS